MSAAYKKLVGFFRDNPDEELSADDFAEKFDVDIDAAVSLIQGYSARRYGTDVGLSKFHRLQLSPTAAARNVALNGRSSTNKVFTFFAQHVGAQLTYAELAESIGITTHDAYRAIKDLRDSGVEVMRVLFVRRSY